MDYLEELRTTQRRVFDVVIGTSGVLYRDRANPGYLVRRVPDSPWLVQPSTGEPLKFLGEVITN